MTTHVILHVVVDELELLEANQHVENFVVR